MHEADDRNFCMPAALRPAIPGRGEAALKVLNLVRGDAGSITRVYCRCLSESIYLIISASGGSLSGAYAQYRGAH